MNELPLRLLILGAHPDDAEYHAGGLATLYRQWGHEVRFISATNGDAGHHQIAGKELAARRLREAQASASVIGATCEVWDYADGHLQATLELRWRIVRAVREFRPDLLLTHRTHDYHPDHRALAEAVRDALYLVTVPALVPEVPIVARDPVVGYLPDRFVRPTPLHGDVALDVGPYLDTIVAMLACHESQFFEWLPFNRGVADQVPQDRAARLAWLRDGYRRELHARAERYRGALVETYGSPRGRQVELAEVFEISEYGSALDAGSRRRLFPFAQAASAAGKP